MTKLYSEMKRLRSQALREDGREEGRVNREREQGSQSLV